MVRWRDKVKLEKKKQSFNNWFSLPIEIPAYTQHSPLKYLSTCEELLARLIERWNQVDCHYFHYHHHYYDTAVTRLLSIFFFPIFFLFLITNQCFGAYTPPHTHTHKQLIIGAASPLQFCFLSNNYDYIFRIFLALIYFAYLSINPSF